MLVLPVLLSNHAGSTRCFRVSGWNIARHASSTACQGEAATHMWCSNHSFKGFSRFDQYLPSPSSICLSLLLFFTVSLPFACSLPVSRYVTMCLTMAICIHLWSHLPVALLFSVLYHCSFLLLVGQSVSFPSWSLVIPAFRASLVALLDIVSVLTFPAARLTLLGFQSQQF
eukprot:GILJ01012666.1.p1 GENE.GILJ01012666.1~~GILJ01012666.1.p1  ORF type:complete len:171 (+),score=5.37 GILJ01012666.1:357-869(+)